MLRCSFCDRTEDQVERIIYGASGCICNDCIMASYQMLMEQQDVEKSKKSSKKKAEVELVKPVDLKRQFPAVISIATASSKAFSIWLAINRSHISL